MKLSLASGLIALTSCQSLSSSATTPTILLEEPVCFSDIEDLEVCAYSSHVRTRRNSVDAQTDQQVKYSRNLEECLPPTTTANAGIAFAFILSYNGNTICANGVGNVGSTHATVQMPAMDLLTFDIGCRDQYTNGYSDYGVDIISGGAYRVLYYKMVDTSTRSGWGWRNLATSKTCDPCQFQDSYYQSFCSDTGVLTTPIAAPTQPPRTVTFPPVTPPTLPPLSTETPTPMPLIPPTQAPTTQPPTTENPTPAPVSSSVSKFVTEAKSDIASLISSDPSLAPKFVRMGFHDCVGGCDGCIDLNDPDNKGLDIPINALDSIVQKYTIDQTTGLTRSDIFALAALTAADVSQGTVNRVDFPFTWFGRVDCQGDATSGPQRQMPSPDLTTSGILDYFNTNFGFDEQETVALMGAHTLGSAHRSFSGFVGSWVSNNLVLSNSYYQNLVGGSGGLSDSVETMAVTTNWTDHLIENTDVPTRWQWEQNDLIMLNADIALVRDFQGLIDSNGQVSCPFVTSTSSSQAACPFASVTGKFVALYKNDELLWLNDFRDVFTAMLLNGYDTSVSCGESICQLS
mmetsp:Transcript_13912/g.19921  ORF Transcript_13912/g.19921 Transcript_13912/m.19921 type:complete len:572 (+) Transcript_13912:114-1829(+)